MPTRKIADPPKKSCTHPEHRPPSMRHFSPGTWEHTCPACGQATRFTVLRESPLSWTPEEGVVNGGRTSFD